ncbi:acyl transferase/acyl hydrolase/lysophospholipase [Mycena albidolilacea]|uniref:Acyl transferase/acyl hydrolase/lysophospholipase n=1 Tax=Mycena albidolilacea TaxID=1033008 RepID=A0AAD6Z098_9AGAR|nr:acyl transferase/acyl hydrolase/lysophospholipase [Mycena albidolilacea]
MSATRILHIIHLRGLDGLNPNNVFSETKRFGKEGKFKASRLETAIQKIIKENSSGKDPNEPMSDPLGREAICRTFVCAKSVHSVATQALLLRTYDSPDEPAVACKIWEAARATSAAPTFFKRIEINLGRIMQPFIDGGLGCNNPTLMLLKEAKVVFPNRRLACVVSIGTGQVKPAHIPRPSPVQRVLPRDVVKALAAIATDCEQTNQDMLGRFAETPGVYFRFNVEQGMQTIKLGQWERLSEVSAHTTIYMTGVETSQRLGEAVKVLKERVGVDAEMFNIM